VDLTTVTKLNVWVVIKGEKPSRVRICYYSYQVLSCVALPLLCVVAVCTCSCTVCLSVCVRRSVARNVTVSDTDRQLSSSVVSSPMTVANGAASSARESHRAISYSRPRSQLEPLSGADVKRTPSIRLQDISSPQLQSSTNDAVSDEAATTKLQPTRAAPPPPVEQQSNKPPQRPPPPCPTTTVPLIGGQCDGSPTGPPPAPPDSRHRFYSTQLPRRPTDRTEPSTAALTTTSVSSMRSKFEPVCLPSSPSSSSSSPATAGQLNSVQQRPARRDVKNSASVPVKPARPQHAATRTSPAPINESQC